jgi:hypothetical protein
MNFSAPFGGNVPGCRDDMARRRLQQKGDLYQSGGYWMLRWHEDHINADGEYKRGVNRYASAPVTVLERSRKKKPVVLLGKTFFRVSIRTIARRSRS